MGLNDFGDYQTPARMALKERAIPLPNLRGKRVLDIGCDHGYWTAKAAELGASNVVGLDRNRMVRGRKVDLIARNRKTFANVPNVVFHEFELGRQWDEFPRQFDVVFLFSLYHHVFQATGGDHNSIWFWLSRQIDEQGVLLWENPTSALDAVVQKNVDEKIRADYDRGVILASARQYFTVEVVGPALHEPYREVWRCRPRKPVEDLIAGNIVDGARGATFAFQYEGHRRAREIENVLGLGGLPYPGSLNVMLKRFLDWNRGYYRAQILDVVNRAAGFDSKWAPRWARFYPITIDGTKAWIFRFEGERYLATFVEIIAETRLRDQLRSNRVTIWR